MLKIDIHTHIIPEKLPDFAKKFADPSFVSLEHYKSGCARMLLSGKVFREIKANCWDAQVRIQECDMHAVDMQVLSVIPVMFNYGAKPEQTLELSRFLNDHIAEVVGKYPKRFMGLGTVPLQDPELALAELERCVKVLGLKGVEIGTHVNAWNLDEPCLFPFYQACESLDAAIFVHPWDMVGKDVMPKYWLPWLVGMPAETSRAICSMVFGGIFDRFPRLRVCFSHGGGSFPGTLGRIEHGYEVRPDLCNVNNVKNPRDYLGKFFVDSLVHDSATLDFVLKLIGKDNVLLGSDYPFPLGEAEPGKLIEAMLSIDAETRELIFFRNAKRWLNV